MYELIVEMIVGIWQQCGKAVVKFVIGLVIIQYYGRL